MMDYDSMPAGLEMDALIAKQIFGAELHHLPSFEGGGTVSLEGAESWAYCYWCGEVMPNGYLAGECIKAANQHHYSTDIADAWKLVDHIGLCVDYQTNTVIVSKNNMELARVFSDAPLAICRASLKVRSPKVD